MIALLAKITSMLALDMGEVMLICVCVCGVIGGITGIIAYKAGKKVKSQNESSQNAEQQENLAQEQAYLEANDGSIVMSRNVIYSADINGQFAAGEYVVENASDATKKFNMRVNGLVREYESGDTITLADGDTLSPVSGSVLLTKFGD